MQRLSHIARTCCFSQLLAQAPKDAKVVSQLISLRTAASSTAFTPPLSPLHAGTAGYLKSFGRLLQATTLPNVAQVLHDVHQNGMPDY